MKSLRETFELKLCEAADEMGFERPKLGLALYHCQRNYPWTCASVSVRIGAHEYLGLGAARKSPEDTNDLKKGADIAFRRAMDSAIWQWTLDMIKVIEGAQP